MKPSAISTMGASGVLPSPGLDGPIFLKILFFFPTLFPRHNSADCPDQDLQIERHRPVLDVIDIVFDPVLERRVTAQAVDLGPAGHAGLHTMPVQVFGNELLEPCDIEWAFGAGSGEHHVSLPHAL